MVNFEFFMQEVKAMPQELRNELLVIAAIGDSIELAKIAIEAGADVRAKDSRALKLASLAENIDIANLLINEGADTSIIEFF